MVMHIFRNEDYKDTMYIEFKKKKKRNKNKNIFNRKLFNGVKIGTTQKSPNYGLHNQTV